MLKSMRSRITLRFVLLLVPFLLLSCYFLVTVARNVAEQDAQHKLDPLRDQAVAAMKNPDWKIKLEQLASGEVFKGDKAGIIVRDNRNPDRNTNVVYRSGHNTPPLERDPHLFDKWRASFGPRGGDYRVTVWQKKSEPSLILPGSMFGLSLIVLGVVAVGTWLMVGGVLSPLRSLASQADQASTEHLSVRLESPSRDAEMRDLVQTLNGLLERVYETAEVKGRFYAAASHELRTPLQALSGHLELAASRKRTAEEYEAVVKESYAQTRRLIALVQGLLFLHQIDTGNSSAQEPVNLTESCTNVLEMVESQIAARRLQVEESFEPNVIIPAVPSHAEVLARNLVENAVKYGTEGGKIAVSLKSSNGSVVFEVVNDYPESLQIATDNVFEPFYRDDTSRNSKTGGNGLGLAICRAVAATNGWDVKLSQEGGKIRAVVDFGSVEPKKDGKPKKRQPSGVARPATA